MKVLYPFWIPDMVDIVSITDHADPFINFGTATMDGEEYFLFRRLDFFLGFAVIVDGLCLRLIKLSKKRGMLGGAYGIIHMIKSTRFGFEKEEWNPRIKIGAYTFSSSKTIYNIFGKTKYIAIDAAGIKKNFILDGERIVSKK